MCCGVTEEDEEQENAREEEEEEEGTKGTCRARSWRRCVVEGGLQRTTPKETNAHDNTLVSAALVP